MKRNIIGQKFGKLTVIRKAGLTKAQLQKWLCECECGNTKEVAYSHLKNGSVASCGCLKKVAAEKMTKAMTDAAVDGVRVPLLKQRKAKNNTSGRRGVSKFKSKTGRTRYRVRIIINGETINMGNYDDLESAIKAREIAEQEYYSRYFK